MAFATDASADTLELNNGRRISNVKVEVQRKSVLVLYQDGRRRVLPKSQVRSLRRRPVRWQARPVPAPASKGTGRSAGKPANDPGSGKAVARHAKHSRDSRPANSSDGIERDVRGVLWLSYVFPGVGHLANEEYIKGSLFLAGGVGALGLAAGAAASTARVSAGFDRTANFGAPLALYLQGTPPFQEVLFLPVYERMANLRHRHRQLRARLAYLGLFGLAVYVINVIDASYPVEGWFARISGRSRTPTRVRIAFDVGVGRTVSGRPDPRAVVRASWALW